MLVYMFLGTHYKSRVLPVKMEGNPESMYPTPKTPNYFGQDQSQSSVESSHIVAEETMPTGYIGP